MRINFRGIRRIAKDNQAKIKRVEEENDILVSMYPFLKEYGDYIESLDAYQVANIIDGVSEWKTLHNKKFRIDKKQEHYTPYRYETRDIVLVKLGSTNIGYEASYTHPSIVLSQGYNWVLIAPCSTGRFGKRLREIVDAGCEDGVKFNTGIQVDNIRVIDKWRIVDRVGRLKPDKFNELTDRIIEVHFRYQFNLIEKQRREVEELNKQKKELEELLKQKDSEIGKLMKEVHEKQIEHVDNL